MSDHIPPLLPWVSLLLASLGVLVFLVRFAPPVPSGRHRRGGLVLRPERRPAPATVVRRPLGVHERPLDGTANRSVRPYVLCGTGAV
ncbi:hypothetical protein ACIOKD_17275 [Streptomyces sp. NPDC087844]|uniref:hypothetical protein n=1 Tax=Streptomyces sp. NPDC087844 TaxID=3365805 RepID=UPI00381C4C65